MDFPIHDLMNEDACYQFLLDLFHPAGLTLPRCQPPRDSTPNGISVSLSWIIAAPVSRVFNAWTGTVFQGTHRPPSQLVLILRGFAQGTSTSQLARELSGSRRHLLDLRHRLQAQGQAGSDRTALEDKVVEADEMYQNAGEKGVLHQDPEDPPRRRANKARGHGPWRTTALR